MSEPAATKRLIVIADNEPVAREAMKAALEGRGYQVEVAENGAMACAAFVEHDPEIIILNIALLAARVLLSSWFPIVLIPQQPKRRIGPAQQTS
jgi:PleD family two-component response regulator